MSQRKSRFSQEHKDLLADFKKDGSGEFSMEEFLGLSDDPIDEQASVSFQFHKTSCGKRGFV